MKARTLRRLSLLLAAVLLLGGCGISEDIPSSLIQPTPTPEDAIPAIAVPVGPAQINTFGVAWSSSDSLCPMTTASRFNLELEWLLYEGLFRLDGEGRASPDLCTAASHAGNVWRLELRTDALFSDGEPFTAADAVYSLELARQSGSNFAGRLDCISAVRAVDEFTLEITTRYEVGRLETLLDIPMLKRDTGTQTAPVGTGLYVAVLSEGESSLRSSPYRRGEVSISTIELVDIPEAELLISNFEIGLVGVVSSDPTATDALVYGGDYEAWDYLLPNLYYLGFHAAGLTADPALRRALASAVDRKTLCENDLEGYGEPVSVPVMPSMALYGEIGGTRRLALAEQPLERVAETLAELGWADSDGDGILDREVAGRYRTTLEPLTLRFAVCTDNVYKAAVARRIAEDLRLIGIDVQLLELSWDAYRNALQTGNFDLYLGEIKLRMNGDISELLSVGGALNYGAYLDEETEILLAAYRAADDESAADALDALCDRLEEECPIVPLLFKRGMCLARRGLIRNVRPIATNLYNNVEYWKSAG